MRKLRFRVSTRQLMILIALIGIAAFVVRQMFFASTVYSVGYDENRFQQVRVGMTSGEVEALMGPPLKKVPWPMPGIVNWSYTDSRPGSSDYWMRDVFMGDDKVVRVVSTYWID